MITMTTGQLPIPVRARRGHAILRNLPMDLLNLRESLDLTQTEVGALTGLSKSTIWRIEQGRDVRMFCMLAVLDWMGAQQS